MDFSIFINWISPFSIWVQLGDIYLKKKHNKIWQSSLKAVSRDPDQMPHSTVSDLGLYCLSHQDVSGKYYHFFIAKITVRFFFCLMWKCFGCMSGTFSCIFVVCWCIYFTLIFLFFFFKKKKTFFFSRRNQNKKNQTASIQSRPDIICPAWSGPKLYVDVISWQ